jgi:hypothetical protein
MGEFRGRIGGRCYRRSRRLARQRRGVVAVVGTLLSLLVFLALFGIFITQFLPLWMDENEAQFTSQAQASFATLKSNIDFQSTVGEPAEMSTPFVMASEGVPLLAQPTPAVLSFIPAQPGVYANVSVTPGPANSHSFFQNFSLGVIQMVLDNRYYSPQTFEFEDDAVIQSQSAVSQIVLYPPGLAINVTGNQVGVTLTLLQLAGNATQTVSTGTQEVYSHFLFAQSYTSNGTTGSVSAVLKLGTFFPCAWVSFLRTDFQNAGAASHLTLSPSTCSAATPTPSKVEATLSSLTSFTLVVAESQVIVGVGVE